MKSFYVPLVIAFINLITLTGVSVIIMFYLKRREEIEREAVEKAFAVEEKKLNLILDELSKVSSALYSDVDAKKRELEKLIDEARDRIDILEDLLDHGITTSVKKTNKEQLAGGSMSAGMNKLYDEVYSLYDSGMSVLEIAKYLKKNKGEIELILNLRDILTTA